MFAQDPGFVIQKLFGRHLPMPGHGDMLGKDSAAALDLPLKDLALPCPCTAWEGRATKGEMLVDAIPS